MSDGASTNNRVIAVINFLAAHPAESFTLSELAEKLNISAGSAHRVLKSLTKSRYLSRHPKHKTYSLGLALVAIGQATLEKHPYVEIAHREMEALSKELGAQTVAVSIVDDEMLTLARAGRPQSSEAITRVGERRPFVPPFGLAHMAWAPKEVLQNYLNIASWQGDDEKSAFLIEALKLVRKRGCSIALAGPALKKMRQAVTAYADNNDEEALRTQVISLTGELSLDELQLTELESTRSYQLSHISAPVFNSKGMVVMEIALTGGLDLLSTSEISHYAERLCAVAAFVTSESHGRIPLGSSWPHFENY